MFVSYCEVAMDSHTQGDGRLRYKLTWNGTIYTLDKAQ
jgi:hypothetical protein